MSANDHEQKKRGFFFDSITDFIMNSRRMIVFHEENNINNSEEVYYLMLPKVNVDKKLHPAFEQLSLESYKSISYLSISSQKDILNKLKNNEVFFIYIDSLEKKNQDDVFETSLEIKKRLPEILLMIYPDLKVRARAEGNILVSNENKKVNETSDLKKNDPSDENNQGDTIVDYVLENHKEIVDNIKNEAVENLRNAKDLIFKNAEKMTPEIKEKGEKIIQGLAKQVSILKKMKR